MYFFTVFFNRDISGRFTFDPNGLPINREDLQKARDELDRFIRETTDSQLFLYNQDAEKNFPRKV